LRRGERAAFVRDEPRGADRADRVRAPGRARHVECTPALRGP